MENLSRLSAIGQDPYNKRTNPYQFIKPIGTEYTPYVQPAEGENKGETAVGTAVGTNNPNDKTMVVKYNDLRYLGRGRGFSKFNVIC